MMETGKILAKLLKDHEAEMRRLEVEEITRELERILGGKILILKLGKCWKYMGN